MLLQGRGEAGPAVAAATTRVAVTAQQQQRKQQQQQQQPQRPPRPPPPKIGPRSETPPATGTPTFLKMGAPKTKTTTTSKDGALTASSMNGVVTPSRVGAQTPPPTAARSTSSRTGTPTLKIGTPTMSPANGTPIASPRTVTPTMTSMNGMPIASPRSGVPIASPRSRTPTLNKIGTPSTTPSKNGGVTPPRVGGAQTPPSPVTVTPTTFLQIGAQRLPWNSVIRTRMAATPKGLSSTTTTTPRTPTSTPRDVEWADAVLRELRALKARAVAKARAANKGCGANGCIAVRGLRVPAAAKAPLVNAYARWRKRRVAPAACTRVQELDGGFFEKFGSGLQETTQRAHHAEAVHAVQASRAHQLGAAPPSEGSVAAAADGDAASPLDLDGDVGLSGEALDENGDLLTPREMLMGETPRMDASDSETEEALKQETLSDAVGWNIEELYSEVLYLLLHNVGSDVTSAHDRDALCRLLREAFKIDDEKHAQLQATADAKEAPKIVLNVEVMEAQDLKPKDANGKCDPFCTLYLSSATQHRYNTSVKQQTLTPSWEEHFSLPVHNASDDVLLIEVWDFDPAETVREKMGKLTDVKGVRGLRKLVKEIAVTASTGKHDNEYIGTAQVALNCIATGGQVQWVNLEKKSKTKKQGTLKLRMAFSAEKNTQVARQEHRHLLRLLLLHHLETTKVEHYAWCGEFNENAATIIRQHAVQSGLSSTDETLAQWVEFCSVHMDHPLNFVLFAQLANKLQRPLAEGHLSSEEVKQFWDATKKFLPSCINSIRRLRKLSNCDRNTLIQLNGITNTLSCLSQLTAPEGTDLFPTSVYGWLRSHPDQTNCDIVGVMTEAVQQGAEDWLGYVLENNTPDGTTEEDRLRHVIKLVQLIRSDLQKAIEYHDKIFFKAMGLSYSRILYKVYEAKVCEEAEPVVKDVCGQLRPLRLDEGEEPLSMGTTLFELYLALQRLSLLGKSLCSDEFDSLNVSKFHNWFHDGVIQWLDIALFKALQRVKKAVELDTLVPVDSSVKYSSSAVDTFAIFYQIKIFWQQLAWPDIIGSYIFVAKIIDDICKSSVFYADRMSEKVVGLGDTDQGTVHEKKFQVTQEWCLAINNIDYVRQSIRPFIEELGMDNILKAFADVQTVTAAEQGRETFHRMIDNSIDTINNKIIDLLLSVAKKMEPAITRFLQEGADLLNQDSNAVDRLMQYLDENLVMLHSELNTENFDRILSIMWDKVSDILAKLVENSLEKRKPPSFFSNLHETLNILIGFFRQGDLEQQIQEQQKIEQMNGMQKVQNDSVDSSSDKHEKLRRIERILRLHGLETPELTYQFYIQRLLEQKKLQENGDAHYQGLLTMRAQFVEDVLMIEILNARNIKPMDSNGSCDPYVKVHLLPEDKFANVQKPRTKTHKKNLYPLFDETFNIPIAPEQRTQGIISFVLKDQDFLGNEFIAEAFYSFEDIPENDSSITLQSLPQVHLKLHRPLNVLESDVMKALEHRQGDKLARDFVKRQKAKLGEVKQQQNGTTWHQEI